MSRFNYIDKVRVRLRHTERTEALHTRMYMYTGGAATASQVVGVQVFRALKSPRDHITAL